MRGPRLGSDLLRNRILGGAFLCILIAAGTGFVLLRAVLRTEMQATISAQQFSVVSLVAAEVDHSVRERLHALELLSGSLPPPEAAHAASVQQRLESLPTLGLLFNWGIIVTDRDGKAIASVPVNLGRTGIDYGDFAALRQAMQERHAVVADPVIGRHTGQPVLAMVVPVFDASGEVVGAVLGSNNLRQPNFLDSVRTAKYGMTGDFLITSPQSRMYVASSDPQRVMQTGPAPGINVIYDDYVSGHEGSGVAISSHGVEELSSSKHIPSTGWLMQSVLPTDEAFAPIAKMEQRLLWIGSLFLGLALLFGWWWLRRQLAPMEDAAARVDAMRQGRMPRTPLPVARMDEIGRLTTAFNGLLASIVAEEAKAAEHASNERLRKIVSHVPGVVFQYQRWADGKGCFPYVSAAFTGIYELDAACVRDSADPVRSMLLEEDRAHFFQTLERSARDLTPWRIEYRIRMSSGRIKWLLVEATPEPSEQPGSVLWYGFVADITRSKQIESELRIAASTFEIQEGIVVTDEKGMILRVNPAFSRLTGLNSADVVGHSAFRLRSTRHDHRFYARMRRDLRRDGFWQGEIWNRRTTGEWCIEWMTISAVRDPEGRPTHYVGSFQDITARKQAEEEIRHLAFYDPLTSLPNRRLLLDRLQRGLVTSARTGLHGALIFIDLDNFKTLNDSLGHDVGDLLLIEVASRLREVVREADTVARLGGDEFVLLLEGLALAQVDAAAQAGHIGEKVLASLQQPYVLSGHDYHGTPSVGVALFVGRTLSVEELLKRADLAMYQAKAAGRNTLRFFDPAMQARLNARSRLEYELFQACESDEFVLYFQPQLNPSGHCAGVEALLRWQHPSRGLVSPGSFIALAEESGLILDIGHWVLAAACRQLQKWQAVEPTRDLVMAVNVSARQFRQIGFVADVIELLRCHQVRPGTLKLELTESLLLEDVDESCAKMAELRQEGVQFALDDFGTGYSSFAYLRKLPLEQIKIDQSFVRDILSDPNDAAICRAIIALADSLGLEVIAEGVEQAGQWNFLQAAGCSLGQGYLLGYPMPAAEFELWLAHRSTRNALDGLS